MLQKLLFKDKEKNPSSYVIGLNPGQKELKVSKDGGDIDAITASTITSRAFLKAINIEYDVLFKGNANANTGATHKTTTAPDSTAVVATPDSVVVDEL